MHNKERKWQSGRHNPNLSIVTIKCTWLKHSSQKAETGKIVL